MAKHGPHTTNAWCNVRPSHLPAKQLSPGQATQGHGALDERSAQLVVAHASGNRRPDSSKGLPVVADAQTAGTVFHGWSEHDRSQMQTGGRNPWTLALTSTYPDMKRPNMEEAISRANGM